MEHTPPPPPLPPRPSPPTDRWTHVQTTLRTRFPERKEEKRESRNRGRKLLRGDSVWGGKATAAAVTIEPPPPPPPPPPAAAALYSQPTRKSCLRSESLRRVNNPQRSEVGPDNAESASSCQQIWRSPPPQKKRPFFSLLYLPPLPVHSKKGEGGTRKNGENSLRRRKDRLLSLRSIFGAQVSLFGQDLPKKMQHVVVQPALLIQ